jgi:hypothetical protein
MQLGLVFKYYSAASCHVINKLTNFLTITLARTITCGAPEVLPAWSNARYNVSFMYMWNTTTSGGWRLAARALHTLAKMYNMTH